MNLLHLSDIHFGRSYPENHYKDSFEKHDEIINGVIDQIKQLPNSLKPEHIVMTGDIAWFGKQQEFDDAKAWFNQLLKACNLTGKDITFIVGNHDLDRLYKPEGISVDVNDIAKIDELYKYENTSIMEPGIYLYNKFCAEIGMIPYSYPVDDKVKYSYSIGYKDIPTKNNKKIRMVALNTSLLMSAGIRGDRMWLGLPQINSLMEHGILPAGDNADFTIGLYHHAERFLHPNETSSYDGRPATLPLLGENCNLLLCGHTETCGKPRLRKQSDGAICFSAGATYYCDTHQNSFAMIYIDEDKKKLGFMPFVYENGSWVDYEFQTTREKTVPVVKHQKTRTVMNDCSLNLNGQIIPISLLSYDVNEQGQLVRFNNHMEIMSDFRFDYLMKSQQLTVSIQERNIHKATTLMAYKKLQTNCCSNFQLLDNQGKQIAQGTNVLFENKIEIDDQILHLAFELEQAFDVNFILPKQISKEEYARLELLKHLKETGYISLESVKEEVSLLLDKEKFDLLKQLQNNGQVYLTTKANYNFYLFEVNMVFKGIEIIAGPYCFDEDDFKLKYQSIQEHDLREIVFLKNNKTQCYLVQHNKPIVQDCFECEPEKIL